MNFIFSIFLIFITTTIISCSSDVSKSKTKSDRLKSHNSIDNSSKIIVDTPSTNDTLFVMKKDIYDSSSNILNKLSFYVDTNYYSSNLCQSIRFDLMFNLYEYNYQLNKIKEKYHLTLPLKKNIIDKKFQKKWTRIYQFKGDFYNYHPCNYDNIYQLGINDSTLIYNLGQGFERYISIPDLINSASQINDSTLQIILSNSLNWKYAVNTIKIIDSIKGLALEIRKTIKSPFNFSRNHSDTTLLIDMEKLNLYKTIICNSSSNNPKQNIELDFEKINFKKLLSHN